MADIPTPLITEILTRLPVKSLLRFRTVSKQWKTLIDSPYFVTLQLNQSKKTLTNLTLILRTHYLFSVDFPNLNLAIEMDHPLKSPRFGTELYGSCDGLLCLSNGDDDEEEDDGTILYNPATRKHWKLPFTPIDWAKSDVFSWIERRVYGFGYDPVNDDYKVVRIIQFDGGNPEFYESEVKVYSLKSNSWKRAQDFPNEYYLSYKRCWGEYLNGCLHWVVNRLPGLDGSKTIVAYDLGTETCREVSLPVELGNGCGFEGDEFHMNVGVLGDCLFVMCNYPGLRTDVWIMKEYGVVESWVKLFSVFQRKKNVGSFEYVRPIAYSRDGSKVLLEQDLSHLIWFDLRGKGAKRANICDMPDNVEVALLVESLVPVDNHPEKKINDQSGQANSPLAALPLFVLCDILSCLPAKTLLQVRCVCKAWNKLIRKPHFAKKHLEKSGKSYDNMNLIIREMEQLLVVDLNLLTKAVQIDHPLTYLSRSWTEVQGSCNGLVCLYNDDDDIAIWNPLTGSYHLLPTAKMPPLRDSHPLQFSFVYGFGYDAMSDDYKVVHIVQMHDNQSRGYLSGDFSVSEDGIYVGSEVQVYTLRTQFWRKIKCFPYILDQSCSGVFASGALHWVARRDHDRSDTSNVIMAFDLGLENCRDLPQPEFEDVNFEMSLELLGESLCVLCHYPDKLGVDIWVMKDYEMCSWEKFISIIQPKPIEVFNYIKPLIFGKNGREVLLVVDGEKLVWYNLVKKTIRHVNISDMPNSFGVEIFSGTLIDPEYLGASPEDLSLVSAESATKSGKGIHEQPQKGSQNRKKKTERDDLEGFLSKGFKLKL